MIEVLFRIVNDAFWDFFLDFSSLSKWIRWNFKVEYYYNIRLFGGNFFFPD